MKRIFVNEKWCLGCHLCEYYCAFVNSGETNMAKALKDKPQLMAFSQSTRSKMLGGVVR